MKVHKGSVAVLSARALRNQVVARRLPRRPPATGGERFLALLAPAMRVGPFRLVAGASFAASRADQNVSADGAFSLAPAA